MNDLGDTLIAFGKFLIMIALVITILVFLGILHYG